MYARIKKHKESLDINVFEEDHRSIYNNKITKDPNIIAQVLIDMLILGFPIDRAIKKFLERFRKKDWIGL